MSTLVAGIFALSVPLAIFAFVFWAYKRGSKSMANDLEALRVSAVQRGMKVQEGTSFDLFAASGTVRGVELHIERRLAVGGQSSKRNQSDGTHDHAQVRGRPVRALSLSLIVPRGPNDPMPEAAADLREIAVDRADFDGQFRTLAADENATRAVLDGTTQSELASFASTMHGRLKSLRCSPQEVVLTLEGMSIDSATIDRAVDAVLGLCAPQTGSA